MIPHRMPYRLINDEISAELKDRVTACRKRLRENRVMSKTQPNRTLEGLFPEAQPSLTDCSAGPAAAVQTNTSFFELAEQTEELEVGIT